MKPLEYISTRGSSSSLSFEEILLKGLAPDGGLYLPNISDSDFLKLVDIEELKNLNYGEMAYKIMRPFIFGSKNISDSDLKNITSETYKNFNHKAVAPLKQIDTNLFGLELFYGPTLAFKDYALQLVGRLFSLVLEKQSEILTIVGATSGDTGSAAIHAVRGKKNIEIFMLHPLNKVSEIQKKQMVTVADKNVHNLAVKGNFDDCQNIVKELFNDDAFNKKVHLGAVNSINFARILAQVVYYFYAVINLSGNKEEVNFVVPTGNFGNIFAGFIAKKMGLKIGKLIIASNPNDILPRFIKSGKMEKKNCLYSYSPSMDIQVSSNFERLLYYYFDKDTKKVAEKMNEFKNNGYYQVDEKTMAKITKDFAAMAVNDEETIKSIKKTYQENNEITDPHSAVAISVAREYAKTGKTVAILTAHPAKFESTVKKAINISPTFPENLKKVLNLDEKYDIIDANVNLIKNYILKAKK